MPDDISTIVRTGRQPSIIRVAIIATCGALAFGLRGPLAAWQQAAGACRISGRAMSGNQPLPGVSVLVRNSGTVKSATSTDPDGTYRVSVPEGTYDLSAELTGFTSASRSITVGDGSCDQTIDFQLTLAPRAAFGGTPAPGTPAAASSGRRGAPPPTAATSAQNGAAAGAQRFETLNVQAQAAAAAGVETNDTNEAARLLLPPGFSTEGPTEAVAINGNMASLDRGMMNDRLEAIGRGDFNPVTGEFGQGFGPGGRGFDGAGQGFGGPGGRGGPGGPGGRGGLGAPGGGRGDFVLGGRGRGQNAYNAQTNYTFGGSALDSAPYQLHPGASAQQTPYSRQGFGITLGGPVRIPHVYKGDRRTNFMATYNGSRGGDLFDQYATVPTAAMRAGDFSAVRSELIDPVTGLPFAGNQIPPSRLDSTSLALLRFIPLPNLDDATRNYHYAATNQSTTDNVNLRVTHSFTQNTGRGGPGGRGGGGGRGGFGGFGGPAGRGRGQQGTSVNMTAQVQYRRNDNDQNNVFPLVSGANNGSSFTLPVSVNIQRRRMLHNVSVNYSRTESRSVNQYAYIENVAGDAGITGVATDPFDWGVPQLSFSTFSSVRDLTPTRRTDKRLALAYGLTRPAGTTHTMHIGGDFRYDQSANQTDSNARGAFVFTGLYSSGGLPTIRGGALDFADFLLGLPQQATVQYGPGNVRLTDKSLSAYWQDDWRYHSKLTLNLGVRYELIWPFYERSGQMVNLDVTPDFTAAAPVISGETGPYTGHFPKELLDADTNNVAPRVGFAWRVKPGMIVRGGYGISYNSGSYSSIARQLTGQAPFAVTDNTIGTYADPLSIQQPFVTASPNETTNQYGIDKAYALGRVQTVNVDLSKDFRQVWNFGGGYTHTRGADLDMVRAPNRGPNGLRIEGVEPFLWQTSDGESILHAATFRAIRRPAKGIGWGVTYTLAKSRDDASSIGGGGTTVAQDDQNLAAEWGLSSFDRRHQLSANANIELPFGPNRKWLSQPGVRQSLFRDWRVSTTFTAQSGTPYTPRVTAAVSDVARGTNGTLRANYTGAQVSLDHPTIDRFFNTTAFYIPPTGTYGNASRNMIIGPGSRLLNMQVARDVRLGGNRVMTIQVNTNNLLNMVNWGTLDTVVNSPTFGQVLSVRGMRSTQLNLRFRF
jgi:trimeric autotransporter adhesin